jgi:pimeloyl-ACP methyl ester carboxylesterase
VHGAFAESLSNWKPVLELLLAKGYKVVAAPNPLRGVSSDAAYVSSILNTIDGPIILVGHSYGGAVITNAVSATPSAAARASPFRCSSCHCSRILEFRACSLR